MVIDFDLLNRYKQPTIKLCKPNRVGQYYINEYFNLVITLKFNDSSELEFKVRKDRIGQNGELIKNEFYDSILGDKVLNLSENFGFFVITSINVENDGKTEIKTIQAKSYDFILTRSEFFGLEATIALFNPESITATDTIVGMFLRDNPTWSVGEIDSEFINQYRTFDISSANWYEFLLKDVEESYECIVLLDGTNRKISIKAPENSITKTNIYISHDNLANNMQLDEASSEVYCAMDCHGGNDMGISSVNPMGGNTIYNFGWLIQTSDEWMSDELKTALIAWQKKYNNALITFKEYMANYKAAIDNLVKYQVMLKEKETALKSAQEAQALYTGTDNMADERYGILSEEINKAQKAVDDTQAKLDKVETEDIPNVKAQLKSIIDSLQFDNLDNFTAEQCDELQTLIKKTTYQNDVFTYNSVDTDDVIISEQEKLYNHCVKILDRISAPRWNLDCDIINFAFLPEYKEITESFTVGCQMRVEVRKDWKTDVICLSATLDFDNPSSMELEISNRYRADGELEAYNDLFGRTVQSASSFSWLKNTILDSDRTGLNSDIRNFINSNLDASKNEIDTASGVAVNISGSGIKVQRYLDSQQTRSMTAPQISGQELRILNSGVYLSDDNFQTAPRTAIGRFKVPNTDTYVFGINAEMLVSNINITEQMQLLSSNNTSRVEINPSNSDGVFALYSKKGDTEERKLWIDSDGNLNTQGKIVATEIKLKKADGSDSENIINGDTKIGGEFLDLKGISITNTNGQYNSLNVAPDGNIKIGDKNNPVDTAVTIEAPKITGGSMSVGSQGSSQVYISSAGSVEFNYGTFPCGFIGGTIGRSQLGQGNVGVMNIGATQVDSRHEIIFTSGYIKIKSIFLDLSECQNINWGNNKPV